MRILPFVTHNTNKVKEISQILETIEIKNFEIIGIKELSYENTAHESGRTFRANAIQKAHDFYRNCRIDCFAEDSGLEVKSLDNQPGVRSSRFAGVRKTDKDNRQLLLEKLTDQQDRRASFISTIALILSGRIYVFQGTVKGNIILEEKGTGGFGYDSVFLPQNFNKTFAEISLQEKNRISHRVKAVNKMVSFFEKNLHK